MFLPFIGLGDDAVVISWIAASLINETESFLHWERDRDLTVHGDVIRGDVIHWAPRPCRVRGLGLNSGADPHGPDRSSHHPQPHAVVCRHGAADSRVDP